MTAQLGQIRKGERRRWRMRVALDRDSGPCESERQENGKCDMCLDPQGHQRVLSRGVTWSNLCFRETPSGRHVEDEWLDG